MSKAKGKKFGPVGRCIYCPNERNLPLSDEHILPAAFGGDIILVDASCPVCQKTINETVETPCTRGMFRNVRYRLGIGDRRVKARPKTLPLEMVESLNDGGTMPSSEEQHLWTSINVPYEEYPVILAMMRYKLPGLLRRLTPEQSSRDWLAGYWTYQRKPDSQPPGAAWSATQGFSAAIFSRQLAKIGHGLTVLHLGLEGFCPFLPDLILGTDQSNLTHLVGGSPKVPKPINAPIYWEIGYSRIGGERYIIVTVRLFADLGAPVYCVVAGKHPKDGFGLKPYRPPYRK